MTQYIDKSALVAEIERRIKETESMQPKFDQFWAGQISAFKGVLKILDTLGIKEVQEEPVSNDLEEVAQKAYPKDIHKQSIFIHGATYAYTHFKNTQLLDEGLEEAATKYAQDKYLPVQTAQSFKAGAEWQKEQMMKEAVYGLVCGHDESSPAWIDLNLLNKPNIKVGTEVKLIIIKNE